MISLSVSKDAVIDEVARTTAYTGSKREDDANAYDRIFTTDADRDALQRFWNEGVNAVAESLKRFLGETPAVAQVDGVETLSVKLDLPSNFDSRLTATIQSELFNYLVVFITGRWFQYSNRPDTDNYSAAASAILEGIRRLAYARRKPSRPVYS